MKGWKVELRGFEPLTPSLRTRCSAELSYSPWRSVHSTRAVRRDDAARTEVQSGSGRARKAAMSWRMRSAIRAEVRSARLRSVRLRATSVVRRKPPVIPSG